MLSDLTEIKQACADDFWRRQIYQRPVWEAAVLTADYKTPDSLLASINKVGECVSVFSSGQSLNAALEKLQSATVLARQLLDDYASTLKQRFSEERFKSSYIKTFDLHFDSFKAWLQGDTVLLPATEAFSLLTGEGIKDALNGVKFKANKNQTAEQRKAEYLAELNIDTTPFDELSRAIKQIPLIMRRDLLTVLRQELDKQLLQLNKLSFDSLISRLAAVLSGSEGRHLIDELRQRFEAALIDEFQDTNDSQWTIFSNIFAVTSHYLYLIGDPKQAIYKFRGADIYAYLDAQKQAHHRFTLGENWRSHPQLVTAVNALFTRERAFFLDELIFKNIRPALPDNAAVLCQDGQAVPPMVLWQLPESGRKNAAQEISLAVVNEIVALLTGEYQLQPANRVLQPKDIAVLVRTNSQASDYQAALRAAGVPSVLNSTESVFASREAVDLYSLLQAVAHPGDYWLLKQALTLDWFALNGQTLHQLITNETAMDAWTARFFGYFQEWQQAGVMAMMLSLLTQEKIEVNLSKSVRAERRLINLRHLIELMQQAVNDEHLGINKILDWLRLAINQAKKNSGSAEEQQLRLESDEDAVQLVTMHRSKGLEYGIVFCPSLWQHHSRLLSEKLTIQCHENGRMVADLGSDDFEARRGLALKEELAEDLRILYVALTRAKYRCYLAWADTRSETAGKDNNSAIAWLLNFTDADFSRQQSILRGFKEQAEQAFDYRLLDVPGEVRVNYQKPAVATTLAAKKRQRLLYTSWQMSSYTALSALSLHETPELPEDKADEARQDELDITVLALPKGAHTGNVVHELLETISFTDLARRQDISASRDLACQRYGLELDRPHVIDELLQAVVATPLSLTDSSFCLMNVPDGQCLKELPFYLSMQTMDANRVNRILQGIPTYQPLSSKAMCGYLTGFIDLICRYNGYYYVIDYKTNSLPNYSNENLVQAMREHNYGLQYWIYSLVLHLYLKKRLLNYSYDSYFGGVRYLFVRGMQPELPMGGVYQDKPDLQRLEALAEAFGII